MISFVLYVSGFILGNTVAVSSVPLLLNREKVTVKAFIPDKSPDGKSLHYRVFDPCICKKKGLYLLLSGCTLPGPGCNRVRANFIFRSKDLEKREYLHPYVEDDRFSLLDDDGACPYFRPISNRHMLLFFSHMSGGHYILGDYDMSRGKFVATSNGLFNFGAVKPGGVYAPSATPDSKGGIIVIFNMKAANPRKAGTKSFPCSVS